jgi:hypothetical protein
MQEGMPDSLGHGGYLTSLQPSLNLADWPRFGILTARARNTIQKVSQNAENVNDVSKKRM